MAVRPESPTLVWLLTALVALGPLSTDLYLPSLPAIAAAFDADVAETQLTLSVFLAGFAVSHLGCGPLADRLGRRPVLMGGMAIYLAGTAACLLAPSIEALIAARFVQSVGACTGPVVARAIVRDVFPLSRAAQVMSYLAMAFTLAPALGPVLGGQVQVLLGWRAAFGLLACYVAAVLVGVASLLPETCPYKDRSATRPGRLVKNYGRLLADRVYCRYVTLVSLLFGGIFAFISGSSFLLIEVVGLRPDVFGFSYVGVVAGYLAGSSLSARLTGRLGIARMIGIGAVTALAGCLPMAIFAFGGIVHVATIVPPMTLFMVGAGMVLPNAMAGAVIRHPDIAGTASALLGFLQMTAGALVGIGVGQLADGTARPMAGAIALVALLTVLVHLRMRRAARLAEVGAGAVSG